MLRSLHRGGLKIVRGVSTQPIPLSVGLRNFSASPESLDFGVFPRETEGNDYMVNWSLTVDGVVPVGDAFRNARLPILTTRLATKAVNGVVDVKSPVMVGKFTSSEAGDSISLAQFTKFKTASQQYLSSGNDLFVEDCALGTQAATRVGVRVVTDNAGIALAARSILMPTPPRPCDHRAHVNGWNLDERWGIQDVDMQWTGDKYENVATGQKMKGQRPVVAFVGTDSIADAVAVEFVSGADKVIVGANVVVATGAPLSALIEGITTAGVALVNETENSALALPSIAVTTGGGKTKLIVMDASTPFDSVQSAVEKALGSKTLYGAYGNILTKNGISAMFGGAIADAGAATTSTSPLTVTSGGKAAISTSPDNLVASPSEIVFIGKTGAVSESDAVAAIVALTDDSKSELAASLVKGAKLSGSSDPSAAI